MDAVNRIVLALALVMSFGLHSAMQCQGAGIGSAASDRCSHDHNGCPHKSTPSSPVKDCCANFGCLSHAQCSGAEETAVSQTDVAHLQPFLASVVIFPSRAPAHSPRVAFGFHSPPAQVPFFVIHHAFLI